VVNVRGDEDGGREQLALHVDLNGTSSVWLDKWLKSDEMDEMKSGSRSGAIIT
jgi:hypothetical protein